MQLFQSGDVLRTPCATKFFRPAIELPHLRSRTAVGFEGRHITTILCQRCCCGYYHPYSCNANGWETCHCLGPQLSFILRTDRCGCSSEPSPSVCKRRFRQMSRIVASCPPSDVLKLRLVIGLLGLVLMMTLSGAYGTRDWSAGHRLLLWTIVSCLIAGQAIGLTALQNRLSVRLDLPWSSRAVSLFLTVPLVAIELHFMKFTPLLPKDPDPFLPFLAFVAVPVFLVGGTALWFWPFPHARLATVDGGKSTFVWLVHAHDHYLEIHSSFGKQFRRGAFKSYTAALSGGIRVHRSWWVATTHIQRLERRGRDCSILLKDGTEVPVARGKVEVVKKAIEAQRSEGRAD